ncbi:MAG: hypothetical protein H6666_10455 [Ardenticatenaceae bacterium]|nr:hypothetical protein [Anaerolineales bacterium]MCB8918337.1 hypothetical protein [Ardenticatenaceae bacterium]
MTEPEYITVLEGPTPDFQPAPHLMLQSVYEGPTDAANAFCELRTARGEDILDRCRQAWREARPVRLDFPDDLRMRQEVDVVAMRLRQVPEGTVLMLWVRWPVDEDDEDDEELEEFDEGEDDGFLDF